MQEQKDYRSIITVDDPLKPLKTSRRGITYTGGRPITSMDR
jgi:hypothetical protein